MLVALRPWWRTDFDQLVWAIDEVARLDALKDGVRTIDGFDYRGITGQEYDRRRELTGIMIPCCTARLLFGAEIRPQARLLMRDGTVI